jgi:hypothetical protein
MNWKNHAMTEFKVAGFLNEDGIYVDGMQKNMCEGVLNLLEVFSKQGHSGFTAIYALNMFETLASFEPLNPLTGEDWEWTDVGDGMFQNKRCGRVLKSADRFDGQAYDIEGIVFFEWCERDFDEDEKGYPGTRRYKSTYTSKDSHVPITFPYKPTTVYQERVSE